MSQTLPPVDLSSVTLNQTGTIPLKNVGPDSNPVWTQKPPHLLIHNESGVGLQIGFQVGGDSFFLPAGGWTVAAIAPGESAVTWQVTYILNVIGGAPVSKLLVTYYAPNENIPTVAQLGNSPIGGAVNTSSIQTLSQEGNAPTLLTIDIGDTHFNGLWTINNDGTATLAVDVAGVKHQVLKVQASANFLQLVQSGDIAEFLGQIKVDQASEFVGTVTVDNTFDVLGTSSLDNGNITTDGAGNITVNKVTFTAGHITRINSGFAAILAGGTNIAHGLGATPNVAFLTPSSNAIAWVTGSDATNISCNCNVNCSVNWLAILR